MLISVLRVLILYPVVIFGIRLMGKRQIGELQPTELVMTLLISNIAALPLEDPNLPLLTGLVPMLVLIGMEVLLSFAVLHHRGLRHLLSGEPKIIIQDGTVDQNMLANLRFTLDDLMAALRGNGIFDITEVQLAIVETNGQISAYQKAAARPVTCGDMQLACPDENPPAIVIADGCVSEKGLQRLGLTHAALDVLLAKKQLHAGDIFLLTLDAKGIRCLIRKEEIS